jgi:hypothetical protein
LGDAGLGAIACGANEKKQTNYGEVVRNWTWKPESVTCKRCVAIYKKRIEKK